MFLDSVNKLRVRSSQKWAKGNRSPPRAGRSLPDTRKNPEIPTEEAKRRAPRKTLRIDGVYSVNKLRVRSSQKWAKGNRSPPRAGRSLPDTRKNPEIPAEEAKR
ncbi:hypothetical protein NDU88_000543 [Pleurodeles waltl]|uniref:Uncharacterized protein n=1 Tax=Pleurodeles waltl TaxID=8319 RepID=A0AAV7TF74_PLEWA|nr:hypothetical protein NDU88_000543 [Pleurodeles waltl]